MGSDKSAACYIARLFQDFSHRKQRKKKKETGASFSPSYLPSSRQGFNNVVYFESTM